MKTFHVIRDGDDTGISGTGLVAEGVEFVGGKCVMCWFTDVSSVAVYASISDVEKILGHGGQTRIEWSD